MTRKALAKRIAETLFNEPATRRGAGAAPTRRACADFGRVLCCSSVKDHSGYSPSSRTQPKSIRRGGLYQSRKWCTGYGAATKRLETNFSGLIRVSEVPPKAESLRQMR
jgi:hypothetical protein